MELFLGNLHNNISKTYCFPVDTIKNFVYQLPHELLNVLGLGR